MGLLLTIGKSLSLRKLLRKRTSKVQYIDLFPLLGEAKILLATYPDDGRPHLKLHRTKLENALRRRQMHIENDGRDIEHAIKLLQSVVKKQ